MAAARDDTRPVAFFITRNFDAPREQLWSALTEAAHLRHFLAPDGSAVVGCSVDLRLGGMCLFGAAEDGGHACWQKQVYQEIWAPAQLVYVESSSDARGNAARRPGFAQWPIEVLTTVTLARAGSGTALTLRALPRNATEAERTAFEEDRFGMRDSFTGLFERLGNHLADTKAQGR